MDDESSLSTSPATAGLQKIWNDFDEFVSLHQMTVIVMFNALIIDVCIST